MENSEEASTSGIFEESVRTSRTRKRQLDPSICPVCSCTLRSSDVNQHLNCEIEKLHKINVKSKPNGKSTSPTNSNVENGTDKVWETYQKVKTNRQSRQKSKSKKRRPEDVVCPVCNRETSEEINFHLETCLRRSATLPYEDVDENIDVVAFEEYEWAGQSRVRATALLEGGASSLGTTVKNTDEDEDLDVDGDDVPMYGSPQYSEMDVIFSDVDKERDVLRKVVLGSEASKKPDVTTKNNPEELDYEVKDLTVEALKTKIRELESRESNREEFYKCLICMERYRTPVVSVCCWHVHCEVCWLQTLGAKKLCPQCNMITAPSDLRRIYI